MTKSRDNHYVPQWYQKAFWEPKKTTLSYLNLMPDQFTRSDGSVGQKRALHNAPPEFDLTSKVKYMTMTSGVSITITSLTNIAGFATGTFTQLPALETFAYFAAAGVFFDYFNQMTFFLAFVVWDVRRSEKQCGDCCGLYFCKPSSKICCGGKFVYDTIGQERESLGARVCRNYSKWLMHTCTRVFDIAQHR